MTLRSKASATALLVVLAVLGVLSPHATAEQATRPQTTRAGQLDAGRYHSCAVLPTATLRCWGYGGDGALGYAGIASIGDDEVPAAAGPVDLGAPSTVRAVAAGAVHTCALLADGSVRCFGFAGDGRLGYANTKNIGDDESPASAGPVDLGAGRTATAITAGRGHSCAILDDGNVRCWGYGLDGRLGYGTGDSIGDDETPGTMPPVTLPQGHTSVKAISAGDSTTCAILEDGSVSCWGYGQNGQLGYGNTTTIGNDETLLMRAPVQLGAGRTAVAIASGDFHTCALLDDATVKCWGYGGNGRLGYSSTANIGDRQSQTPASVGAVQLGEGRTAKAITAGTAHTCALLDDDSVRCWGNATSGQLGYGNRISIGDNEAPGSVGPVDLGPGRTAVAISAGGDHTCATLDDAGVRCWGEGFNGELGLCDQRAIGDDELPASVGLPDLGIPGVAGTVCAPRPSAPPSPSVTATVTEPAATAIDTLDDALRLQSERGRDYRACRSAVTRQARLERAAARRRLRPSPRRTRELSTIARRAAVRRNRCRSRFRRTPGRVTPLTARADSGRAIVLRFKAPGSDGSRQPAARGYLIKQSSRPIRTSADFERATALCEGTCFVDALGVGADIRLQINDLQRRTTYHYAIAARDNVTARPGPRSESVRAKTR